MSEYLCYICYKKRVNVSTPCNHDFCYDCITQWILINPSCPYCRYKFNDIEDDNIICHKIQTRSNTFKKCFGNIKKNIVEMLENHQCIINRDGNIQEQKNSVRKICKYIYNNISFFLNNPNFIKIFMEKLDELEQDVYECTMLKFKLREKGILI